MDPIIDIALLPERLVNIIQHQNEVLLRLYNKVNEAAVVVNKTEEKLNTTVRQPGQKLECIFCPAENDKNHHTSLHCTTYKDAVARTSLLINLGLCIKCISHHDNNETCYAKCRSCGASHHSLLCSQRRTVLGHRRPY
uniref:Phorbol-ester/DAG-type domain-containing protein n=1 Tax=Heterorhabditis bacteriophora TaxID=37862 RepID=A0A1I7XJ29_HETBA